jgi:hypothetical protein
LSAESAFYCQCCNKKDFWPILACAAICRTEGQFVENFIIAGLALLLLGLAGDVCATPPDAQEATLPATHVVPAIRNVALPTAPAATISNRTLTQPWRSPMVFDRTLLEAAPRIVAAQERRSYLGKDDKIYVQGELRGESEFRIVRPGRHLSDPLSKESLGDELVLLGTALLQEPAEDGLQGFLIVDASREIMIGDRLLAMPFQGDLAALRAISSQHSSLAVDALIVSIADGTAHAGQHQIVAINKGALDGISEGKLLRLSAAAIPFSHDVAKAIPRTQQASRIRQLPQEERGRLLIVRVFDRVSYGLITQALEPVQVGDKAYAPQQERTSIKDVE